MKRFRFSVQLQIEEVSAPVPEIFLHYKTIRVEDFDSLEKASEKYREVLKISQDALDK